jgi:serine/threonine-protein kinase
MLGSRWIVGGLLGRSETAEVYEAEATSERRFAALKLFDRSLGLEPAWSEHAALTRALSELPGDGLARAYDAGIETGLGRPYVASERITFPTVAHYVSERGALPLRVIAQALATLASALDAAHAAGIVHGGLKPQNVFVSFDNPRWARLTDFGVTRLRSRAGRGPATLLGWSAPDGVPSAAADRYALALVCFFGATGCAWYSALRGADEAASDPLRTRLASERAKNQGAELEPAFDGWFAKALDVEPSARFGSAVEMANAFIEIFTAAPTAEMPARPSLSRLSLTAPIGKVADTAAEDAALASRRLAITLPTPETRPGSASEPPRTVSSMPPRATSSFPPRATSSAPPRATSSSPPRGSSSFPPLASSTPRWFWFACAAMASAAVLAVWWLSRY